MLNTKISLHEVKSDFLFQFVANLKTFVCADAPKQDADKHGDNVVDVVFWVCFDTIFHQIPYSVVKSNAYDFRIDRISVVSLSDAFLNRHLKFDSLLLAFFVMVICWKFDVF